MTVLQRLTASGIPVLPCVPGGKAPETRLVPNGMDSATTHWPTVEGWLRQAPTANWAVRTGPIETGPWARRHLAILDVDDVLVAAAVLERTKVQELTAVTRTPRGGLHIWALSRQPAYTGKVLASDGSPLGDLKGTAQDGGPGGYVLVFGQTEHGDYDFRWGPGPILVDSATTWFESLLSAAGIEARLRGEERRAAYHILLERPAQEGERNITLFSYACALRRAGLGFGDILRHLQQMNTDPSKVAVPLPHKELERIAISACRYEAGNGHTSSEAPPTEVLERELAESFTDANLAHLFAELARDQVLFVPQWGWLYWDGRRWARDEGGHRVMALAMDIIPRHFLERAIAAQGEVRAQLLEMARKAMSRHRLSAALELAKGLLLADPSEFDRDPFALNCLNGTVDLRTGELRPHTPADRLTKLAPVEYDPNAEAPTWQRFLEDVFCGDKGLIEFVQRAVGYSATGDVREDCFYLCYGNGGNGKTTFLNTIRQVLGDYGQAVAPDLLVSRRERGDTHPAVLADLYGARFCMTTETQEDRRLDEARAKMLTGRDPIKARYLHRGYFEFQPTHKIWLATNHLPVVSDTTEGMWRRVRVIPFLAYFGPDRQDKELPQKLLAEGAGILTWVIQGARRWLQEGLGEARAVSEATNRYRTEMDILADWLQERCAPDPQAVVPFTDLYADYAAWCERARETPISKNAFARRLTERGFEAVKLHGNIKARRGLRLLPQDDHAHGDRFGDSGDRFTLSSEKFRAASPTQGEFSGTSVKSVTQRPNQSPPEAAPIQGETLGPQQGPRCSECGGLASYTEEGGGTWWCWAHGPSPTIVEEEEEP